MAGDWIKWAKGLPDKPEVIRLAGLLSMSRETVACRLMRFWEWCDDNIAEDDINVSGSAFVTLSPRDGDNAAFIDALVCTPSFADSLSDVGWLRLRDGRIELPNFGRHNGETAKTRARNAKTQTKKRLRKSSVSGHELGESVTKMSPEMSPRRGDKTVTRGEERREEEENPPANYRAEPADENQVDPGPGLERRGRRPGPSGSSHRPDGVIGNPEHCPMFRRFWDLYPWKIDEPLAAIAFKGVNPDEALLEQMLAGLERNKASAGWRKENGKYIPKPENWLRHRRWEESRESLGSDPAAETFDKAAYAETLRKQAESLERMLNAPVPPNPMFQRRQPDAPQAR